MDVVGSLNRYKSAMKVVRIVIYGLVGIPAACGGVGAGGAASAGGDGAIAIGLCILAGAAIGGSLGSIAFYVINILIFIKQNKFENMINKFVGITDEYTHELLVSILDTYKSNYNFSLASLILSNIFFGPLILGGIIFLFAVLCRCL